MARTSDVVERPLLFLDVDGVLLPTDGWPRPSTLQAWDAEWQVVTNPALGVLDPAFGLQLLDLGCELVWATAWLDDANVLIGPRLGLPTLPVLRYGHVGGLGEPGWDDADDAAPLHRKTVALVEHAAGRPFGWLDDELTGTDRRYVREHHPAAALLHRIDQAGGLQDADLAAVRTWVSQLDQRWPLGH